MAAACAVLPTVLLRSRHLERTRPMSEFIKVSCPRRPPLLDTAASLVVTHRFQNFVNELLAIRRAQASHVVPARTRC
jgi:hypothetical protein